MGQLKMIKSYSMNYNNIYKYIFILYSMKIYCLKCRKFSDTINPIERYSSNRKMISGQCSVCFSKKNKFVK